jgi:hypothetical protein
MSVAHTRLLIEGANVVDVSAVLPGLAGNSPGASGAGMIT